MFEIAALIVIFAWTLRIWREARAERALFHEFGAPTNLGQISLLIPASLLSCWMSPRQGIFLWIGLLAAAISCVWLITSARTASRILDTAGTDRVAAAKAVAGRAFLIGMILIFCLGAGLIYAGALSWVVPANGI